MSDFIIQTIPSILIFLATLITGYWLHIRETKKYKLELIKLEREQKQLKLQKKQNEIKIDLFNKILDLRSLNNIKRSVDRMFKTSGYDRFLILIAINGKDDFNNVSVVFEQFNDKKYEINATARYKNIKVDSVYRRMLKEIERSSTNTLSLTTKLMEPSLLKNFYEFEEVKYSNIRFLLRDSIDADNDVLIYSSISTHREEQMSDISRTYVDLEYQNSIIPNLKEVLK